MDEFLGTVKLFAGNYAPQGWALCDGSLVKLAQNQALYAILGTTYGGDGMTTFALPNLPALAATDQPGAALHYIICLQGIYPVRE